MKLAPTKILSLKGHKKDVWAVAFHPGANILVSAGDDAQIITWNLARGQETGHDHINEQVVHDLDFDGRGRVFAAVGMTPWGPAFSGIMRVQHLQSGQVDDIESRSAWTFQCVAIHPAGRLIAAGGADRALRVWDLGQFNLVQVKKEAVKREFFEYVPPSLPDEISAIAFHPLKPMIAAACKQGFVRLFDIRQDRIVESRTKIAGHKSDAKCAKFHPMKDILVTGGQDGSIRYWNASTGDNIRTIEAGAGPVNGVAFSPDGVLMASAHAGKVVKLWDTAEGKELHALKEHEGPVLDVAISPSGRHLASAGRDFAVIVWSLYPSNAPAKKR